MFNRDSEGRDGGSEGQPQARVGFTGFEFDPVSGEIFKIGCSLVEPVARLAPQPARLLAHLIQRSPEIVGSEEIRRLLWPGVQVDFEPSLRFCIRQIRAALSDSAAEPRWVETIPRRGYRFIAEIGNRNRASPLLEPAPGAKVGRFWWRRLGTPRTLIPLGLSIVLAFLLLLVWWLPAGSASREPGGVPPANLRVAVMSFEPSDPITGRSQANDIAEELVRILVQQGVRLEVIGPTTTVRYERQEDGLSRLANDYQIDFVLNGRGVRREGAAGILAEVIRASDGAHVWVQLIPDLQSAQKTAESIIQGFQDASREASGTVQLR